MIELMQMWALVEVLGLACLPLTVTVFHNLPDRGWAFSKALAIALLAFCVWLPLMLWHTLPFSQLYILGTVLVLLAFSLIGLVRTRHALMKVIRLNVGYIVASEIVFLGMVFLLGWVRSFGPDIRSYEMFMDEGFIAAIMRSPHLPPNDIWFAGYSINYYYYAHFAVAVLAKLLGQAPSIAFNTGICMYFGLTAVNLFGVTCNIVAWARHLRRRASHDGEQVEPANTAHPPLLGAIPYGLLTMAMGLVLGNLAATQQWWLNHGDVAHYDWFAPSRVIDKTINEFPAFSFLLSCFHAHVLALAFTILAIGLAFNLLLEHDGQGLYVFGRGWQIPFTLGCTALVLGGLFTMNGWDFPTYVGLAIICIGLQQWLAYQSRFCLALLLDILVASICLVALSFLLYLPFYLNFISPSQGIGIVNPADRSSLGSEILIYGLFAFIFLSLLLASASRRSLFGGQLSRQGNRFRIRADVASIAILAIIAFTSLVFLPNSTTFLLAASTAALAVVLLFYNIDDRAQAFTLLLGAIAFGLVAVCEIFFLKDVFAGNFPRMNTVFKFYFQAWALLSIASGAGLFFILESFRPATYAASVERLLQRTVEGLWGVGLLILLLASMVYPLLATPARYQRPDATVQGSHLERSNSLDGMLYLQSCHQPDCSYDTSGDYAAIRWLNANVQGDPGIIEAVGDDYSFYGRISTFTGLPAPMGWVGHEYQWRVNWLSQGNNGSEFERRSADVETIYTATQPEVVLAIMNHYHAQYLYVGALEYAKYASANLHRFSTFMQIVYNANGVTIYKVK
ncbi:MAG TPA: DUF2298 domain-containing protein [Ktedonosporobacter sp.]|jgi:YYY domain-containing protein|nr:DUF2298 domain-containing protein [Ktedonosporobacter sp.]